MAITVSITEGSPGSFAVGNQTMNYTVTVANSNASSVTLTSLSIADSRKQSNLSQPNYLTPNVPVGVGSPVIAAGASVSYGFQCVFNNPVMPGPSPQAPGGAAPTNEAYYPDSVFALQATSYTSDGTVAYGELSVPVLTKDIPQDSGGALVLSQGFNLINFITL